MQIPDSIARHLDQGRALRALLVERQALDEKTRTATLAFASETPYERYWGIEILDCAPSSMRPGRLRSGANLLCDHDQRDVVGVVESVSVGADRIARAVVRFGKSARAEEVWQDVRDGIRRNVSVGYLIHKAQLVETSDGMETYRVTDWEPFEVSLVSIPADATVGIGRSADSEPTQLPTSTPFNSSSKEKSMTTETPTRAEQRDERHQRAADIALIAASMNNSAIDELAMSAVKRGISVEQFQREAIEKLSTKPLPTAGDGSSSWAGRNLFSGGPTEIEPVFLRTADDFHKYYQAKGGTREKLSLSEFMRGVAGMKTSEAAKRALSVGVSSAGGFAVPDILMPEIMAAMVPASSLLQAGAAIVPLREGPGKEFSFAAVDTLPVAYWRQENAVVQQSEPTFRNVVLTPRSLSFFVKVSRELLADGINMEQALRNAIAQAFANEMDRSGLRGTGTAPEIRGLKNMGGVHSVTNGTNGAVLGGYANIFSASQLMLEANAAMPSAVIMSPRSLMKLGALLDTTNQPLQVPPMLQAVKQIHTSQIPNNLTVGSSSDCSEMYVGDFKQFVFGMREDVSIQVLEELYADYGQIGFMCHARVDVAALYPKAFAVVTGVR